MQPVTSVVVEVVEIDEGGLGEVVVGEAAVTGLGRDHGLAVGREGRVTDGEPFVVSEVSDLLVVGEGVAA